MDTHRGISHVALLPKTPKERWQKGEEEGGVVGVVGVTKDSFSCVLYLEPVRGVELGPMLASE